MDSHLNSLASKIGMTLANLKPTLQYMTREIKKRVVTAKVKSIALYGSQLVIGQSQSVIQCACVLIMRVNRAMHNNIEGLRSTSAICRQLKIDEPRQELIKSTFSYIHKIIENKKPDQIISKLRLPNRKSGKVYIRGGSRSMWNVKTPIHAAINRYNAIPADFRTIKHKKLKPKLKKVNIEYSLFK